MFYVWNGRGARLEEREAAFNYATSLCGDSGSVVVLNEGENDEDEMFWAVIGDGDMEYAKASYWTWRAGVDANSPQIWKISASPNQRVGSVCCVTEKRLSHPSSRISLLPPTRRSKVVSSFWTSLGRYLFSLAPRLGVSGKIFGWLSRPQRYAPVPKNSAHTDLFSRHSFLPSERRDHSCHRFTSLYSLHKFRGTSVWPFEVSALAFRCVRSHGLPLYRPHPALSRTGVKP